MLLAAVLIWVQGRVDRGRRTDRLVGAGLVVGHTAACNVRPRTLAACSEEGKECASAFLIVFQTHAMHAVSGAPGSGFWTLVVAMVHVVSTVVGLILLLEHAQVPLKTWVAYQV